MNSMAILYHANLLELTYKGHQEKKKRLTAQAKRFANTLMLNTVCKQLKINLISTSLHHRRAFSELHAENALEMFQHKQGGNKSLHIWLF